MKKILNLGKIILIVILVGITAFVTKEAVEIFYENKDYIFIKDYSGTDVALPTEEEGITSIIYSNGFYTKSLVLSNDNVNIQISNINSKLSYNVGSDEAFSDNIQIKITENEKNGMYSGNGLYKAVKGLENQQISVIAPGEISCSSYCEKATIVPNNIVKIFGHTISEEWSKNIAVTADAIRLEKDGEEIYIYYLNDEAVIYEEPYVLNTSAIISKTGETTGKYNIYLMFDQTVLFEVLATSDDALEEAFIVREVRGYENVE